MVMKKLFMMVLAAAFVLSFLPKAEAGDNAQLGLRVTFAIDQDLEQVLIIKDHVYEMEKNSAETFSRVYVDRNGDGIVDRNDMDLNGDGVINQDDMSILKSKIEFVKIETGKIDDDKIALNEILQRRPDLRDQIVAVLEHAKMAQETIAGYIEKLLPLLQEDQDLRRIGEIKADIGQKFDHINLDGSRFDADGNGEFNEVDVAYWLRNGGDFNRDGVVDSNDTLMLKDSINDMKACREELKASAIELAVIRERRPDLAERIDSLLSDIQKFVDLSTRYSELLAQLDLPVISIELTPATWTLEGMKLADKRDNSENGVIIHRLINKGVAVKIEMGYGPIASRNLHPGMEAGVDVYATEVEIWDNGGFTHWNMIPPNAWVLCAALPAAGPEGVSSCPLHLGFMSPTGLTKPETQLGVTYEFRAYKAE